MRKLEKIKLLISDLLDLKEDFEALEKAQFLEDNEGIENIKKSIKDFDKNAMIIQLIEILEKE